MKIGLYFGSFNPIHSGHLIIASHVVNETDLEKVWFIVSPQNPLKRQKTLLDANKRFDLVKRSIYGDKRFFVSDVEFHLPTPSFTFNTLNHLKKHYPQHSFNMIVGSDIFRELKKWKNFTSIINSYKLLIYPRPGFIIDNKIGAKIKILNAPFLDISSSKIRELIQKGKSIRYLVPEKVRKEIERNHYYKK